MDANSVDLHFLFKRLQNVSADNKNLRRFCDMRFKGLIHVRSVIYGQDFHEMHARLPGPKSVLTLYQLINKT